MRLSDVTVVVRSSDERTTALCVDVVSAQAEHVQVLKLSPWPVAIARCYEIGIAAGRTWTLGLDADILLFPRAIERLIEIAGPQPDALGCAGWLLDKFYGDLRVRGAYLYRTAQLPRALEIVRTTPPGQQRPETRVHDAMKAEHHAWLLSRGPVGLHGYAQFYRDIFQTNASRAVKSAPDRDMLVRRARLGSFYDRDFTVMQWALDAGSSGVKEFSLDRAHWTEHLDSLFASHGMVEKAEMTPMERSMLRATLDVLGRVPPPVLKRAVKRLSAVRQRAAQRVNAP